MKVIKIRKRSGSYRTVVIPSAEQKTVLRSAGARIAAKAAKLPTASIVHGFALGRSPVTNAQAHVGRRFTVSFDLADFFDTVTADRLKGKLSKEEAEAVLYEGRAAQGLPSSPAVANLAAADMDRAILKLFEKLKIQVVYTRYADDLTFSFDDEPIRAILLREIPCIVSRCGFKINPRKTSCQSSCAGFRVVTGIAVTDKGIQATRATRRRLRAAQHQGNIRKARGLAEWAACRLPRPPKPAEVAAVAAERKAEAEALAKFWSLRAPNTIPEKIEVRDGDFLITGDPAYTLGMSTYTTGWRSCMAQPDGQYRKGVIFWLALPGTRIAALLSDRTATYAGVTRRVMRARCLIHELRNGTLVFDRVYGDEESQVLLIEWLEKQGASSLLVVRSSKRGIKVRGNVDLSKTRPYADTLSFGTGYVNRNGKRVAVRFAYV